MSYRRLQRDLCQSILEFSGPNADFAWFLRNFPEKVVTFNGLLISPERFAAMCRHLILHGAEALEKGER